VCGVSFFAGISKRPAFKLFDLDDYVRCRSLQCASIIALSGAMRPEPRVHAPLIAEQREIPF
jgi:hypothetical protein